MKVDMATISTFVLKADSWMSMATHQFLGITAHGITEDWRLVSFLLDLLPVTESETADYIAQRITATLQDWDISDRDIVALTSGDASNIKSAAKKKLCFPWVWCAAHCLHLVVVKGILSLLSSLILFFFFFGLNLLITSTEDQPAC